MKQEPDDLDEKVGDESDGAVVLYEPGIAAKTTLRATITRFLPGAALSAATGVMLMGGTLLSGDTVLSLLGVIGISGLGYAAGLELLRRHLYPDARVEGRRSLVAGLIAPLAVFVAAVVGGPTIDRNVFAFAFLPALIIAVLMFFAWLTPTPEEMRDQKYQTLLDRPSGEQ